MSCCMSDTTFTYELKREANVLNGEKIRGKVPK